MFGLQAKLIALVILATVLSASHWKAYSSGKAAVRLEWQADIQQRTAAALEAEQAARAVEVELQAKAATIRRTKDAQIHSLGLELDESLRRLRNRPERPAASDVPPVAGTGGGSCTGADLYRPDAEFLVRLAASADQLRIGLEACQQAYRAARAVK
jgi:hypothetical protein